jgi:beta-N-acetylhexosaminidase
MMGFDGTSVTPHIRTLIEEHHVGCILLTAKNLKCQQLTLFVAIRRRGFSY